MTEHTRSRGGAPPSSSTTASSILDPANLVNKTVKIINLTSRPELNSHLGVVQSYSLDRSRYRVVLEAQQPPPNTTNNTTTTTAPPPSASNRITLLLKADNLAEANFVDKVKFQVKQLQQKARCMIGDAELRRQFQSIYSEIDSRLPQRIKPEHLLLVFVVLLVAMMRVMGVTKALLLFSVLAMVPLVCIQDLMAMPEFGIQQVANSIVTNFPRRWRMAIVEATGYHGLSERMTLLLFTLILLLTKKVLFTPQQQHQHQPISSSIVGKPTTENATGSLLDISTTTTNNNLGSLAPNITAIYELGFQDAKEGREFGTSLPISSSSIFSDAVEEEEEAEKPTSNWPMYDDFAPSVDDDNNNNTTKETKRSKFGFGTVIAALTLFRTGKELVFHPDGRFDLQLLVSRMKVLETWRLGVIGLCVYRLVTVFL